VSYPDWFDHLPDDAEVVLDPAWLAHALDFVGPGERIVDVDPGASTKTVAEKICFAIAVEGPHGVRHHYLCAKAHFHDNLNSLLTEASFYRHLQPHLGVRSPRAHYTGVDPSNNRGLIVMDDVVAMGGTIGDAHQPYAVETCRDALGQLARLHARTWADPQWDLDWLSPRIEGMASMFPSDRLQSLLNDGRGSNLPAELRDAATLTAAMHETAQLPTTCVIHGDPHSGNGYVNAEGQSCWFDWQIVQRGHWSVDVAYHLGTVLTVEDRRRHESELLGHYLAELESHGVPAPPFNEAWERYALGFTWGYFLWAITSISSREVVLLHVPRLGAALDDHDSFQRLGVL
jgi:aminoglycoside phosphotransferase (APT) family kinase protein